MEANRQLGLVFCTSGLKIVSNGYFTFPFVCRCTFLKLNVPAARKLKGQAEVKYIGHTYNKKLRCRLEKTLARCGLLPVYVLSANSVSAKWCAIKDVSVPDAAWGMWTHSLLIILLNWLTDLHSFTFSHLLFSLEPSIFLVTHTNVIKVIMVRLLLVIISIFDLSAYYSVHL